MLIDVNYGNCFCQHTSCGTSSADTNQSSSDAFGICFSENLLNSEMAILSADICTWLADNLQVTCTHNRQAEINSSASEAMQYWQKTSLSTTHFHKKTIFPAARLLWQEAQLKQGLADRTAKTAVSAAI